MIEDVTPLCISYSLLQNIYYIVITFLIVGLFLVLLSIEFIWGSLVSFLSPLLPYGLGNCHFVML